VIVRMCLTLIWIGSALTWGHCGWGEVRWVELGQMQRQRYGLQKTDYDMNLRFRLSGCCSFTLCTHRDLHQDLPLHQLPLFEEGQIQSAQNLLLIAGSGIESETNN